MVLDYDPRGFRVPVPRRKKKQKDKENERMKKETEKRKKSINKTNKMYKNKRHADK